jgi:hypothetical protein
MSATKYGQWRYLFAQQIKLEKALATGVKSFAQLASTLAAETPIPAEKTSPSSPGVSAQDD